MDYNIYYQFMCQLEENMNKHKKKCEHLKTIRKNMADSLGVELNQTECTYEGDCGGTCAKCQKEEQTLAKVLLKGTAVAATTAMLLTGCSANTVIENVEDFKDEVVDQVEDIKREILGPPQLQGAVEAIR